MDGSDDVEAISIQPEQVAIRAWAHSKAHELSELEHIVEDVAEVCETMCHKYQLAGIAELGAKESACLTQCVARFFEAREFIKMRLMAAQDDLPSPSINVLEKPSSSSSSSSSSSLSPFSS
eukprot:g67254.t1